MQERKRGGSSVCLKLRQTGLDFLKKTFGRADLRRFDGPDGRIMHAEVRVRDTVVMIADAGGVIRLFLFGCMLMYLMSTKRTGRRWRQEGLTRISEAA